MAQPADDQSAHRRRIAEADLGLGRVNVDVDLLERNVEEQSGDRVAVAGDQVAVGGAQGADEQAVLHRPRIDEQILLVGHAAVEGRQADHAGQPQPVARAVDADAVTVELVREQLGDARRRFGRLKRQDAPAVMVEREADIAARHRQPLHRVEAGGIFGARASAGTCGAPAPCRTAPRPGFACPGGSAAGPSPDQLAMIDLDSPAVGTRAPGFRASAARRWRSTAAPRRESRSSSPDRSHRRAASRSHAARARAASRPALMPQPSSATSISSSPPA